MRRSIAFVVVAGGTYLATLTYFTGWQGLLLYFVAPWFAIHAWFSITTLMHHSAEDIPYLPEKYLDPQCQQAVGDHGLRLPAMAVGAHPQHLAAHRTPRRHSVPFYNLGKAQAALKRQYPDLVRIEKASVPRLWNILRKCRFYDPISGLYSTRPMQRVDSVEAGPA